MTGLLPPAGSMGPWGAGPITRAATCLLAPNAGPMTLDGTNTWVIAGAGRAVVVDPGPDDAGHLAAIVHALDERDAAPTVVLLTHGHADHSAGAVRLAQRLGVGVRALDPVHRLGDEGLTAGDVVEVGDVALRVLPTPGHSADSLSFVLEESGGASLLTGDTVLGRGTTVVAHPEGVLADYLDSLRALRALAEEADITRVLPGHGPALANPIAVLDYYLAHRAERLDRVRAAMLQADDLEGILAIAYADVAPALLPAARLSLQAQLAYLRA